MTACRDCGSKAVRWLETHDRMILFDDTVGPGMHDSSQHWRTCKAPNALRRRKRKLLEPGIFPASVTRVQDYRGCPLYYQRRHLEGAKLPVTPEMMLGRATHQLAAALSLGLPEPDLFLTPEIAPEWPALARSVREVVARINPDTLIGVEERLTMSWPAGAVQVDFEVVPDRLELDEDLLTVLDYKLAHNVPSVKEAQRDLQLMAYGLAGLRKYPWVQRVRGRWLPLMMPNRSVEVYWTREELEAFGRALEVEVNAMAAATEFPPADDCVKCPPGWHPNEPIALALNTAALQAVLDHPKLLPVRPPQDAQEAHNLATAVHLLSQINDSLRDALRAYTGQHGPVALGKGGYGHWVDLVRTYDVEEVITWLKAQGEPLQPHLRLNLSGRDTRRLLRRGLRELIIEHVRTKFRWTPWREQEQERLATARLMADETLTQQLEQSLAAQQEFVPQVVES